MKAKTVIKTAADFLIETDLFDALEIGGKVLTMGILTIGILTMEITRNPAVSCEQRWQSEPYGKPFMNSAG